MSAPHMFMRVGDQLPTISCQILNMNGDVVQLPSGSKATVLLRPAWYNGPSYSFQAATVNDVVSYDWQYEEALVLEPGTYDFSVRVRLPTGQYLTAPSDHHCDLIVGSALIYPGHVLDPRVGYGYTPDPGQQPAQTTLVAKVAGPETTAMQTIAAKWGPGPFQSYSWQMNGDTRRLRFTMSLAGSPGEDNIVLALHPVIPETEGPYEIALAFDYAPYLRTWTHVWYRLHGQNWVQGDREVWDAYEPIYSPNDLLIGALGPVVEHWQGQIWYVELRNGLDPREGEVMWRFAANDGFPNTSAGTPTWTDEQGTPWTVTDVDAIE